MSIFKQLERLEKVHSSKRAGKRKNEISSIINKLESTSKRLSTLGYAYEYLASETSEEARMTSSDILEEIIAAIHKEKTYFKQHAQLLAWRRLYLVEKDLKKNPQKTPSYIPF